MDAIFAALEAAAESRRQNRPQAGSNDAPAQTPAAPVRPALDTLLPQEPPLAPGPPAAAAAAPAAPAQGLQALFEDGNILLRAIVASEVLAPPRALRENDLWTLPPKDPST